MLLGELVGDDAAGVGSGAERRAVTTQGGAPEIDGDQMYAVALYGGKQPSDLVRLVDGDGALDGDAVGGPAGPAVAVVDPVVVVDAVALDAVGAFDEIGVRLADRGQRTAMAAGVPFCGWMIRASRMTSRFFSMPQP